MFRKLIETKIPSSALLAISRLGSICPAEKYIFAKVNMITFMMEADGVCNWRNFNIEESIWVASAA